MQSQIYTFFLPGFLAAIFFWAAITKTLQIPQTQKSFESLQISSHVWLVYLVSIIEFTTGILLTIKPLYGAQLAIILLAVFTGILHRSLQSDRSASCACFGSFGTKEISWKTIARNMLFLSFAIAVVMAQIR